MADFFATHSAGLDSPAQKAFAITADDNNDLAVTTRAIYSGAGGTLVAILADDASAVTFSNLPAGQVLPIRVRRVLATGTSAGINLIGLA